MSHWDLRHFNLGVPESLAFYDGKSEISTPAPTPLERVVAYDLWLVSVSERLNNTHHPKARGNNLFSSTGKN
jgi:hypothetical protein